MTEVSNNNNLSAHYSANPKVNRPTGIVATAPVELPKMHLFNDKDANIRMNAINQDIYQDSKKEEKRYGRQFIKVFGACVLAIMAFIGLKRFFK